MGEFAQKMREGFRIAVGQSNSRIGDVAANLEVAASLCREAAQQGAELILLPEAHATGYSYGDLGALVRTAAEDMSGGIVRRLRELAVANRLVVCCGMFEREGERFYNSQVVAYPDGEVDRQRKGVSAPAETEVITLDPVRRIFSWRGCRFGILICADSSRPDAIEQYAHSEISLILHPCAGRILHVGPDAQAATAEEADLAFQAGRQTAKRAGVTYAAANLIGFSGEDYFPGNSWIIQPGGSYLRMPATAVPAEMHSSIVTDVVRDLVPC